MARLPNYLRSHRKRLALSQEEAAFLLGVNGMDKGIKVCREENHARLPSLKTALAYEAMYGVPVRELFAGLYEQVEQEVAQRATVLAYRVGGKSPAKSHKTITSLASKLISKTDE